MGQRRSYRYRTGALVGPWRTSRRAAADDAVTAAQAVREPGLAGGIRWLVEGQIEEQAPQPRRCRP